MCLAATSTKVCHYDRSSEREARIGWSAKECNPFCEALLLSFLPQVSFLPLFFPPSPLLPLHPTHPWLPSYVPLISLLPSLPPSLPPSSLISFLLPLLLTCDLHSPSSNSSPFFFHSFTVLFRDVFLFILFSSFCSFNSVFTAIFFLLFSFF